jgi:CRP/FNR family transcriptional regulator, cyclic AMP receptor protein
MPERSFSPGEFVYQEGDKSDFAYFVKTGRVEILKSEGSGLRQVTVLGPGDVFGEMGVVLDQRRSVTVRALERVTVRAISRSSFIEAVNQQPDMTRSVLKALFTRLHQEERPTAEIMELPTAARRKAQTGTPGAAKTEAKPGLKSVPRSGIAPKPAPNPVLAAEGDGPERALERLRLDLRGVPNARNYESDIVGVRQYGSIRILGDSEHVGKQLDRVGIEIQRLPFQVGRQIGKHEDPPEQENDLSIEDERPYNLSRRHFAIEQSRRGLIVRDCGSHVGTLVNGARIGGETGISVAILKIGDNAVIAGSDTSPFRFTIQISPE